MTPFPSPSSLEPTAEIDARAISAALNRKFKSQAIFATVKFDPELEISLSGLSVPHPEQTLKVVAQVLGELQLPTQTVKVCGQQNDATAPDWERDIEIQPIARVAANRVREPEPERDRHQFHPPERPDNHMILAILATFFGVLPLGVVAISYACQVESKHAAGDYRGADRYANNAKRLSVISLSVSAVVTALVFLAVILPLFLSGGYLSKIKEEKAALKYTKTVLKAKADELMAANMNNAPAGISNELTPTAPTDIGYTFTGETLIDSVTQRHNFKLVATPTGGKLHSFVGFAYTIEQGSNRWIVKTDACLSKATSFYPPTVTITNGSVTCDADSKLASEMEN
jgi:Interferon-induced transmembrane protein